MKTHAAPQLIEVLRQQLNGETAVIGWPELQRHFARGVLIKVAPGADLVDVAAHIAADDRGGVAEWLAQGVVTPASTEDAIAWQARQASFWAVVTAPWVLVQEILQDYS